jgi:hypothetical protein
MDRGEITEGTTWRGLSQILEEKAEVKGEVKPVRPCTMRRAPCNEHPDVTWKALLGPVFAERAFFSQRKETGGRRVLTKEKSSRKVLDYFFEKAWDHAILKSHQDD